MAKTKTSKNPLARKPSNSEYVVPANDNISRSFKKLDLVPAQYRGTEKFLDVVTWNIRFFHDRDPNREKMIASILASLNADIIVLQEILDNSLYQVTDMLKRKKAGYYQTVYGTTGGNQRIAMMYDLDFIRAKDEIIEIYKKGEILASDGRDVFPRLPLLGRFTGLTAGTPFDFQLLGVHLKSQRGGGGEQRQLAAKNLAAWLEQDAPKYDADVIVMGDWNELPDSDTWGPIHQLEEKGKLKFREINNGSDISHLMYKNKKELGSRLDLCSVSMSASEKMGEPPSVVKWAPLEELLKTGPSSKEIKGFLSALREEVSDHLPVLTRFYFHDEIE